MSINLTIPDLSPLNGLMVAGYPLATLLFWGLVAGIACVILGIIVHMVLDHALLIYIGAGILISVGGTVLVNII